MALSHARRFGKSQAAGMIKAYYSSGCDSKELFDGFDISYSKDYEKYLNRYNVIHLDVSTVLDFHPDDVVDGCISQICEEVESVYGS